MRVTFDGLIIENFATFVGRHAIDFAGRGPGLHYIYGDNQLEPELESNGAGKSIMFDALSWCLYGTTTDKRKTPDIRPREYPGKQTMVVNRVFVGDKEYMIERTANPNSLTLNGKECAQHDIDNLIMPFSLFSSTVLIGQGQPLFYDLTPAAKMQMFSDVLGLERWIALSAHAKKRAEEIEAKIAAKNVSLAHWQTIKAQLDETISRINRSIESWEASQDELLRDAKKNLKVKEGELAKQQDLHDKVNLKSDGAETEVRDIEEKIRKADDDLVLTNNKNNEIQSRITYATLAKDDLDAKLGEIKEADNCPTCGQKITGTALAQHRKELRQKIRDLEASIEEDTRRLLTKQLAKISKDRLKLYEDRRTFKAKADDAKSTLNRLTPVIADLKAEIKVIKGKIEDGEKSANPYRDQLAMNKRQRSETVGKIREIEEGIPKSQAFHDRLKFWTKGFKDIRLYVIDEVLSELELVSNEILEDVGLVDWLIRYEVERETQAGTTQRGLNILIQGPKDKKPVKWQCWSKGEGQRLRLVGAMALSDVLLNHAGMETNLEIYDEPTVHMSERGIDNLCELLARRAEANGKTVFFIDHKAVESSHFASTLTVVKSKKGESRIEND